MGLEWSQEKLVDLRVLWRSLPSNIKIEITREKVTVTKKPDFPKLDISTRVTYENYNIEEEHDLWADMVKQLSDDTGSVKECFNFTERLPSIDSTSSAEVIPKLQKPDISGVHSAEMEIEMSTPEVEIISPPVFKQSTSSSDLIDEILERKISTLFDTFLDIGTDSDTAGSVEPLLQQQYAEEYKLDAKTDVDISSKGVQLLSPVNTANGAFMPKKIPKVYEQKGKLECHVYFTPRASAQIWPHLILTVHEDWDFLKIMRKSIAQIQRTIKKGDRDGTHDWVFGYHPNKQVRKIKKELRVLFGGRAIEFRDSNLNKKIKTMTKNFVNKIWVLQKKSFGEQDRGRSLLAPIGSFRAKSMPHLTNKQEDNLKQPKVSTDENFGERDSPLSSTSVISEVMHWRKPTPLLEAFLDIENNSELAVEAILQQQDGPFDGKTNIKTTPQKVQSISQHKTANVVGLPKKIATVYQHKGKLECHVWFTPRTSVEVWPYLVVTVHEDWDFLKVMRKSIAEIQRTIKKGDRDGTHDWVFAYEPNKHVMKIKKELRVIFGEMAIEFRDSNLKKKIKTKTEGFVNKI